MDGAQEVDCELVVAGRNAAVVLQAAEHALDRVAVAIEHAAEAGVPATVALGRDVRDGALFLNLATDGVRVIGAVGEHEGICRDGLQQRLCGAAVGSLADGEQEAWRASEDVCQGVDLGRASATADADRLGLLPPFPPAAQRCAFTCVLSSRSSAGGPPAAARASKISRQTPLADQRTKRL